MVITRHLLLDNYYILCGVVDNNECSTEAMQYTCFIDV